MKNLWLREVMACVFKKCAVQSRTFIKVKAIFGIGAV